MSLRKLWASAHPNSSIRKKYPTIESVPEPHDDGVDYRGECELSDWFDREILLSHAVQDWEDSRDYRESTDQPGEVEDFLVQGGWHVEYTDRRHRGIAGELWTHIDPMDAANGWLEAERLINIWARTPTEKAFLLALACGHSQGEARRISGLNRPEPLLTRIRNNGNYPPKGEE